MKKLRRWIYQSSGQTATEYMLMISVVAIAAYIAYSQLWQPTVDGAKGLAQDNAANLTGGSSKLQ
jgi:hypothetical protein